MTATTRPELGTLTVGQPVIVRRSPNDSRGRKPEDRTIPAVVTKVGRVWVEMEKPGETNKWSTYRWRMRMDTQNEGSKYSGSDASFATPEQQAWDDTRTWAFQVLGEHGIRIEPRTTWYGREIELADLLVAHAEITALKASRLLTTDVVYPRFLGLDGTGSYTWELEDGRWCWAEDPDHAVRQRRTFTPERYIERYGKPEPIKIETKENKA